MPTPGQIPKSAFLNRLLDPRPLIGVELRPPRSDLSYSESMDTWIDMYHSVRKLARRDTVVFLTDNAVGRSEEENLQHITANLANEVDPAMVVPFLTCKHSLDYCLMYAARAASQGVAALTVLGGDKSVGPPRCVSHAFELRRTIRQRIGTLQLGGWANPHRSAAEQVDFMLREDFTGEFFLTQIVSHHDVTPVEQFVRELEERGVSLPGVFGVFLYRSANPNTLRQLAQFFPVPARAITRDFDSGLSPEAICATTISALREVGCNNVYVSNLGFRRAEDRYRQILAILNAI